MHKYIFRERNDSQAVFCLPSLGVLCPAFSRTSRIFSRISYTLSLYGKMRVKKTRTLTYFTKWFLRVVWERQTLFARFSFLVLVKSEWQFLLQKVLIR